MLRIFLPLYLMLFIFSFYSDEIFDHLMILVAPEAVMDDTVGDLAGAFYMAEELLLLTPTTQWPEKLAKMSSVNIPVRVIKQEDLTLTKVGMNTLQRGGIWIADIENDIALKAFGTEGLLIQIGPITTTEFYDESVVLTLFGGSGALVIFVVLWSLTVQYRIQHLTRITQRFGSGELSIRASESNYLRVGDLNHNFNTMAERIQQLIESHKHLSNAVSHELRTPISRIKFELDYAWNLDNVGEMQTSLDSIAEDIDELEELVSEALTYARFERAGLQLNYETLELNTWLDHWQLDVKLPLSDIKLTITNAPLPYIIELHPSSIKRALDNLVLNASRYAKSQIKVTLKETETEVYIYVDDDGLGIPKTEQVTIFDPFIRTDKSRSKQTGGFGLGLAIVKQIMLRHQGQVEVSDSPLGGARFVLHWPKQQKPDSLS